MAENSASPGSEPTTSTVEAGGLITSFISEIVRSPVNLVLVGIIALLVYKIVRSKTKIEHYIFGDKQLPKLRRDFTVEELRIYDGTNAEGRILVAMNGNVYDCTRGAHFYGPGGPYAALAGRDASRSLATFSLEAISDEYDDLSDLDTNAMNAIREWDEQLKEKYDYVGKLLKPGEAHTNYSDEEDEGAQQETESKPKTN